MVEILAKDLSVFVIKGLESTRYSLSGVIKQEIITQLEIHYAKRTSFDDPVWSISLMYINNFDSAFLSLCLSCIRWGRKHGIIIKFIDVPPSLKQLAKLYEIDDVLCGYALSN